ncbi:hypothetical protein CSC94_07475 [Zhengella mangrovi]|uniref:Transmembrane protein n=1 Tax=Zhengella mangrovi TaxID=1982044 RepID=A0A2G1QQN9_9HYPH|nr:hypothetical protein [Zhengella mangrovi]PHP67538.1 hypothetical protein CSC94_07475 [Zhengella mangrovi]
MYQPNTSIRKVDEHLLLAAVGWLTVAVVMAVYTGMAAGTPGLVHAYVFMVGFCATAIMGLTYRLFPGMKASRLAKPQLWTWLAGTALLFAGRLVQDLGGADGLFQFASVLAAAGAILFAAVFLGGRVIRPDL